MGRLFDAGAETRAAAAKRQAQDDVKRRAAEVEKLLQEELHLDEASKRLGEKLGGARGVTPVHYTHFRARGSKWEIEHARAGDDYIYQLFPLRPPLVAWQDVMMLFIAVMDSIFPRNVKIVYAPPNESYSIKFYTIKVEKVAAVPGWEPACKERALHGLANVDAWPSRPGS